MTPKTNLKSILKVKLVLRMFLEAEVKIVDAEAVLEGKGAQHQAKNNSIIANAQALLIYKLIHKSRILGPKKISMTKKILRPKEILMTRMTRTEDPFGGLRGRKPDETTPSSVATRRGGRSPIQGEEMVVDEPAVVAMVLLLEATSRRRPFSEGARDPKEHPGLERTSGGTKRTKRHLVKGPVTPKNNPNWSKQRTCSSDVLNEVIRHTPF